MSNFTCAESWATTVDFPHEHSIWHMESSMPETGLGTVIEWLYIYLPFREWGSQACKKNTHTKETVLKAIWSWWSDFIVAKYSFKKWACVP